MRIIKVKPLKDFWVSHPDFKLPAQTWITQIKACDAKHLAELKTTYPSADLAGKFTVFNLGGNKYRLIVFIDYEAQIVFVRHVLTHAEYDKERWKNDDWYK